MRDADLSHTDAWHPCAFSRGAWSTASLTALDLEGCHLDVIPFQVRALEPARGAACTASPCTASHPRTSPQCDLDFGCWKAVHMSLGMFPCKGAHVVTLCEGVTSEQGNLCRDALHTSCQLLASPL